MPEALHDCEELWTALPHGSGDLGQGFVLRAGLGIQPFLWPKTSDLFMIQGLKIHKNCFSD
jgi:hypothetical protein